MFVQTTYKGDSNQVKTPARKDRVQETKRVLLIPIFVMRVGKRVDPIAPPSLPIQVHTP